MYENRQRIRNANFRVRFEKPFNNTLRNPQNNFRRPPLPFPRRHTLVGRYSNEAFRHKAPAMYRPDCPIPGGIHPGLRNPRPNPPVTMPSSFAHRPPFNKPRNNFFNKNNQFPSSNVSNIEGHLTPALNEQNYESRESTNVFSDLWVEALAPGGKIYYYNTRTRESTWEKPRNVRIIELHEIKQLPIRPNEENSENERNENSNHCAQQQPMNNSQVNFFYPQTFSVSQPRLLLPPNIFAPPANFLTPAADDITKNVANVRYFMPPPLVPFPVVPRNLFPNNVINDSNINNTQNLLPSSSIPNFHSNVTQDLFLNTNIAENNSNVSLNFIPINNINEYNSNIMQNFFPNSNNYEYNSDLTQGSLPSNDVFKYDFNITQGFMPLNNTIAYESNVTQDLLPNPNTYEIDSNMQNLLQDDDVKKCSSNATQELLENIVGGKCDTQVYNTQDLSSCASVPVYNCNVVQNLSSGNETDCITNTQQDLSKNEIVDFPKHTFQTCLSGGKINDRREQVKRNLFSTNQVIDYSSSESNEAGPKITITDNKEVEFGKNENENTDINSQDISQSSSQFSKITISNHKDTTKPKNENSANMKSGNIVHNEKIDNSDMIETKFKSSVNLLSKHKAVDKSRPVSSTPIPGSYWCVVWTGDERVFFYDSQHKISVWERPAELLNRTDVDKMVKKSPLSLDLKPLIKESRKNSSDRSDATKKQKTNDENSDLKETTEKVSTEKATETERKSKIEPFSREWKIEMFCEMLADNNVSVFSTWEKEVHKIVFDSRYLLLQEEERKQVFKDYVKKKSEEEINKHQKEESQKEAFLSLLMEANVTSKSKFSDLVPHYRQDGRFAAIEEQGLKENIFIQYISELKQKEREREKHERELKTPFIELLSENCCFDKEWPEVENIIADNERHQALHSDFLKETPFKEFVEEKCIAASPAEKQNHPATHLDNCEEEVKQDLSAHREKTEAKHKYELAVSHFKSLLKDLIVDTNKDWEYAKVVLKTVPRWKYSQYLGPETCEKLFNRHISAIKRDQFYQLLDEFPEITIKTSWLDIRKDVLKDPRCVAFSSCERKCEEAFKEYLNSKRIIVKDEFKQLLKETNLITSKSKNLLKCSSHYQDIEKALSDDKRYLNLECIPRERRKLLLSYIDGLQAKGSSSLSKPGEQAKHIKKKKRNNC